MKNVGNVDKVIRVIIGFGLISLVFIGPQTPWGWIGLIPLVTAFISFCPLYSLTGINSAKSNKPKASG